DVEQAEAAPRVGVPVGGEALGQPGAEPTGAERADQHRPDHAGKIDHEERDRAPHEPRGGARDDPARPGLERDHQPLPPVDPVYSRDRHSSTTAMTISSTAPITIAIADASE